MEKRRYNLGEILPEESADIEKLKIDLLNLEKKFVDTELSVAEIKEKLKTIPTSMPKGEGEDITGIKERMEEIEDLIMVEQAALLELKKLMEEKGVGVSGAVSVPPEIETLKSTLDDLVSKKTETDTKLQNIERELAKIRSVTVEKAPEGMIEKLGLLVKETEDKLERFRAIEEKAKELEMRLEKMKGIEGTGRMGELDALRNMMDKLTERIAVLEKTYVGMKEMPRVEEIKQVQIPQIDELTGKISETNTRIQDVTNRLNDLNKRIEILESTQKSLEGIKREFEEMKSFAGKGMPKIEAPSTFETQINTLIEKTVFLESRLGAIERIIRETIRAQPVVLE